MTRPLFASLLVLTVVVPGRGQNSPGTEHWVAFMENLSLQFNNAPSFHLVISSETDAAGQVVVPATGLAIPFSVQAFQDEVIDLPQNIYYAAGDEAYYDFGLRVESDEPVNVHAYHDRLYFSEATLILPTGMLGDEYLILAHDDDFSTSPSEFVVLATVDGTDVEITPSVMTASFRPPGLPFTITLDEGQSYQTQAYEDLSGTRVHSTDPSKPIAVFSGARQARVNCTIGGADDHLYNQLLPLSQWGRDYLVVPYLMRGPVHVHAMAGLSSATVNAGGVSYALQAGESVELNITVPTRITGTADFAIGQFNDSQDCNGASGDPAFLFLPPLDFRDYRMIWNARTGDGTPEHYVNVLMPSGDGADPIFLDGVDVSDEFMPVPNVSGFWFAQIPVSEGHHDLQCNKPVQAVGYGFGEYNSYSYSLGFENGLSTALNDYSKAPMARDLVVAAGSPWQPGWHCSGQEELRILDTGARLVMRDLITDQPCIALPLGPGLYLYERWGAGVRIGSGRLLIVGLD